jgi:hypothetical protein
VDEFEDFRQVYEVIRENLLQIPSSEVVLKTMDLLSSLLSALEVWMPRAIVNRTGIHQQTLDSPFPWLWKTPLGRIL